jgi:flavodoxin
MADKDVDRLKDLFDDKSVFVHMGGSWGKEQELKVIASGGIHYKKTDVHEASVQIIDNTAIVLNRITLLAVVGGSEVTNPFIVTEVYVKQDGNWKLGSLSFTKTMGLPLNSQGTKPILTLKLLTVFLCLISLGGSSQECATKPKRDVRTGTEKILIVYLSRTNNTKAIAEIIHKNVGGALVQLELMNPYPEDYKTIVAQVARENETGFLPPLKTKIDNIQSYDVVFVGFPTWGMQLPPPMKSFLKQYDLNGKTIIPFNTNGGYGIGSTFRTVRELCENSTVLEGFSTEGGVERDGILFVMKGDREKEARIEVKEWLQRISILK